MKISDCYQIEPIIREFEGVFQISATDYEEYSIDVVLKNVRNRISTQYQIDLVDGIKISDKDQMLSTYYGSVESYIESVCNTYAKFCGLCHIARYRTRTDISLSSINFLGFEEDSVRMVLQALQRCDTQVRAEDSLEKFKTNLLTINNCREKRLILIMLIAYDIGFNEVTATIAEYLYLSCME